MALNINRREKYTNMGKSSINKSEKFIDINFDLQSLNLMCVYVLSESPNINRSNLINMRNLFSILNKELYINDNEKVSRFNFIVKGLEARLIENLKDPYIIIKYINGGLSDLNIVDPENLRFDLSSNDIQWINSTISESLTYTHMYNDIPILSDLITRFNSADYSNKSEIVNEFKEYIASANARIRKSKVESRTDAIFSLKNGNFEQSIIQIHEDLSRPSSMIYTGMQGVNELLGGGLSSGRVYMFFGLSGGGKSLTLLDFAYQIKKYNKNIKCKDPSKIPCVVIFTQENTVKETVDRLFSMSTGHNGIKNYSPEEVIRLLRQEGELYLNNESPIDIIIKFKPSGSVDTSYLYTLVEDLEDDGYECICLLHDYVKHIRSSLNHKEVRLELGQVVQDYKTFASIKDIPVLGVSQLNRDGARTIDAAAESNMADLTRLLGRSNIGESLLMLDNLDFAGIIGAEFDRNGNKYLIFKRIKQRFYVTPRDYICQPYLNKDSIQLVEDFNMQIPVFKETLKELTVMNNSFNNTSQNNRIVSAGNRKNLEDVLLENMPQSTNIFETRFNPRNSTVINNKELRSPFTIYANKKEV